jgi:hypothetical protein
MPAGSNNDAPPYERIAPGGVGIDNIGSPSLVNLFLICGLAYLAAYALEAPIRFVLYVAGKDSLLLARDSLIIGPLLAFMIARAMRLTFPMIFLVSGILLAFHAVVLMGTIGSFVGAAYGAKILINLLFGYLPAGAPAGAIAPSISHRQRAARRTASDCCAGRLSIGYSADQQTWSRAPN